MRGTILLVVLGIVLAAALGFAAHVVAQDTVGLPAVELEGGRPLAPEEAREEPATTEDTRTETEPEDEPATTETGEDDGPVDDNSGSGSDDSGSGDSSGSGSGSDDSGRGRGRGRGGDDD